MRFSNFLHRSAESEITGRKMQQTVKNYFPNINLRVVFKAAATIESHFHYKDKVTEPKALSKIVNHLKCTIDL